MVIRGVACAVVVAALVGCGDSGGGGGGDDLAAARAGHVTRPQLQKVFGDVSTADANRTATIYNRGALLVTTSRALTALRSGKGEVVPATVQLRSAVLVTARLAAAIRNQSLRTALQTDIAAYARTTDALVSMMRRIEGQKDKTKITAEGTQDAKRMGQLALKTGPADHRLALRFASGLDGKARTAFLYARGEGPKPSS